MSTFPGLATIWPTNSLLARRQGLWRPSFNQLAIAAIQARKKTFPNYVAQNKRPQRGLRAEAVSCFWIPQVGYGIPSPGDHVSPAGDARF
jgi:hypothetical protein